MKKEKKTTYKRSIVRKIINTFIGLFGFVIFIFIISFGFMQTSTFRGWLKNKIISTVDQSINGTINISHIDGTILTSLYINDVSVSTGKDTIFSSERVALGMNPIRILIGQIYVRNLSLLNTKIALKETSENKWDFENLIKKNEQVAKVTKSKSKKEEFPFNIIVKNLDIDNLSFSKKTLKYQNYDVKYDTMNYDDIAINNFNLNAAIAADFNKHEYVLLINNMSASPNLKNFKLNKLNGLFEINSSYVKVDNLNILTDSSSINLTAKLDGVKIFSSINIKDFTNYPLRVSLTANPLNFSDITSFINSTNILKGNIIARFDGSGKFGDINITRLKAELPSTSLELSGHLKNLSTPNKLFIDASIVNSHAQYKDVLALLPTLDLPPFSNFELSDFNTSFKGEPTNFHIIGSANVDNGKIKFNTFLNLQHESLLYDAKLITANLNIAPVINIPTLLNGRINLKGKGTNPTDLNTKLKINLHNSLFRKDVIDSVNITANAVANIINLNLKGIINNSVSELSGKLDFSDLKNPFYNFVGTLNNLDLEPFTGNEKFKSDLNFNFSAKGKYLDIDKTVGEFKVDLDSSTFSGKNIYGSSIKLELKKDSTSRLINLYSNFADIYVNGDFKITNLVNLLSYQSGILSSIIAQKISDFNPRSPVQNTAMLPDPISSIVNKNIHLDYSLNFKDFSLIQLLLQNDQFNVKGSIQGAIQNDSTHFEISSELNLDKLIKIKNNKLVFLSGINADINISRDNQINSFKHIIGALTFTGQRLYTGNDFHNINLDVTFNDSLLFYDASADLSADLFTGLSGTLQLRKHNEKIFIDTLEANYKKVSWKNNGQIVLSVKKDSLFFDKFNFYLQNSAINVGGFIADSTQNLILTLNKLPLNILSYYIRGGNSDSLKSSINLTTHIKGSSKNPIIDLNMQTGKIMMSNFDFGSFICNLKYQKKNITTDIRYASKKETALPLLFLKGNIPIDLSLEPVENRAPLGKQIDLQLQSKKFNLNTLGNILPFITGQSGRLKTNVSVTGNIYNPIINGDISISNGSAKVRANNLIYNFDGNLNINNGNVTLSHFDLSNSRNSKYKGKMSASGSVAFESHKLKSLSLNVNGNLALLSDKSKEINPFLYGDLFVETNGPLLLTYSKATDHYLFAGNINLKNVNLTYSSPHSGFASDRNGFNYIYVIDSSRIDSHELDFMNLLSKTKNNNVNNIVNNIVNNKNLEDNFDYKIKINTENNAVFTMNLAKDLGQKLIANLKGSIVIDKIKGQSNAQGSFQLLEGSRLEFFKTLSATGEIRFEKNLFDPYIDVTASYLGDYVSSSDPFSKSQEVAVKIELSDPLSKLGSKLSLSDENFAVYVGRKDIDSNIPNTNYDVSDALAFILLGKFKKDLTSNTTLSNTGTSASSSAASYVISPLLSSFLNTTLGGGVIEDIQISQPGRYYRLGISGKVQNLRYRIGGTSEALSDIAKANILIQYFFNKDLSIRLERRYPIIYSEGTDERVNEFGLRYKFEF